MVFNRHELVNVRNRKWRSEWVPMPCLWARGRCWQRRRPQPVSQCQYHLRGCPSVGSQFWGWGGGRTSMVWMTAFATPALAPWLSRGERVYLWVRVCLSVCWIWWADFDVDFYCGCPVGRACPMMRRTTYICPYLCVCVLMCMYTFIPT